MSVIPIVFGACNSKEEGWGASRMKESSKNVFNWTISIVVMKIEYLYDTDV